MQITCKCDLSISVEATMINKVPVIKCHNCIFNKVTECSIFNETIFDNVVCNACKEVVLSQHDIKKEMKEYRDSYMNMR